MQSNNLYQCPWPLVSLPPAPVSSMGAQASSLRGPVLWLAHLLLPPLGSRVAEVSKEMTLRLRDELVIFEVTSDAHVN